MTELFFLMNMKRCFLVTRVTLFRYKKKNIKKEKKRYVGSSHRNATGHTTRPPPLPLCKHSLWSAPWTAAAAQLQNLSRLMSTRLPRLRSVLTLAAGHQADTPVGGGHLWSLRVEFINSSHFSWRKYGNSWLRLPLKL